MTLLSEHLLTITRYDLGTGMYRVLLKSLESGEIQEFAGEALTLAKAEALAFQNYASRQRSATP